MKKFISQNWKRIIYVFAGFAILVNLINVAFTPAVIVEDYYKYGPTYSHDILDKAQNLEFEVDESAETMAENTGMEQNTARIIIIFSLLLCGVLILSNIVDGGSAPAKKK